MQTHLGVSYLQRVKYVNLCYFFTDAPVHEIGDKVEASWTDEQLTVYDCHARLQGYDFVGVIDLDEFLVPKHGTLHELIVRILFVYMTLILNKLSRDSARE